MRSKTECHLSLRWQDYRLLPYERDLGLREVKALLAPRDLAEGPHTVELRTRRPSAAKRLTYFSAFRNGRSGGETVQAALEATAGAARSRRQATRYSVHGLHDYKGKFNPQTAKAIFNILGLKPSSAVLDPFCGSGTTLVECLHNGYRGFGLDANPLAVLITRAKISALQVNPEDLRRAILTISRSVGRRSSGGTDHSARARYLRSWFPRRTCATIEEIRRAILPLDSALASVLLALASNLLREYSLQEPADLRIRRRTSPLPEEAFPSAFEEAGLAFASQLEKLKAVLPDPRCGGVVLQRRAVELSPICFGGSRLFDAVVCSPPYATALPYIDTQRLSIVWLGLARPRDLRHLEGTLTGNRECSERQRRLWNGRAQSNADTLPGEVARFCRLLHEALGPRDGFRRIAVPGLLYKYFVDMRATFRAVSSVLKPGAPFALVVGHNRTTLGGRRFEIVTPQMLARIARVESFSVAEITPLQTYQRYGLHSHNGVSAEALVVLRKR